MKHHRSIGTVLVVGAALALTAPAAQARPVGILAAASSVGAGVAPAATASLPPDRADGLGSGRLPTVPTPTVVVRTTTNDSFNWTDAAIGAASGLGAGLLVLAATMARGRRREPLSA
jgi:hypothetical protein